MMEAALILSLLLHRDPALVRAVYELGGMDAVAVVECESGFNRKACRLEPEGTSWGLFQLYDKYHEQHRDYLWAHIESGAQFLAECKVKAGGDYVKAVSYWNSGSLTKQIEWGKKVAHKRDELEAWLIAHEGIAGGKRGEL